MLPHIEDEVVRGGRDLAFVLDTEPGIDSRGVVQLLHDQSAQPR